MTTKDLNSEEYNVYYQRYIDKVSDAVDLSEGFSIGKNKVLEFFNAIPEENWKSKYKSDKWTIKEVLQHLTDTERIFAYRVFRIARDDKTPLSSFDQNTYVRPSKANQKSKAILIKEYEAVRESTIALINSLSHDDLCTIGVSSDVPMSARAAAFIIIGHEIWHMDIVKERYL
ncbi:MAG: DinB family protein [Aurantibacter sp.]